MTVHFSPLLLPFFPLPFHCPPTPFAMEKKITEKIAALPPDANYFSLEFFPPKTRMVG
jgi:methylenetetrahydrofolate reductase (NADPH)